MFKAYHTFRELLTLNRAEQSERGAIHSFVYDTVGWLYKLMFSFSMRPKMTVTTEVDSVTE